MSAQEPREAKRGTGILSSLGLGGWKVSTDVSMVSYYLLLFFVGGLGLVILEEREGKPFTAVLWALACFTIGAMIGFLFGIPRVLQHDGTAPAPSPSQGEGKATDVSDSYSLKVNTNLEQISDWLTKIFVGLGLVQLQRVPEHLNRAATFVAYGLGSGSKFFAGALIVYFSILGFLGFYLITRLYIAGALSRADREATQMRQDRQQVQSIDVGLDSPKLLTEQDRKAALNLVRQPVSEVTTQQDLAARAKALLSLGKYDEAADLYRKVLRDWPNEPQVRFEYAISLFYLGNREQAYQQMLEAYKYITPSIDPALKKNIYRSLTFQALYQPPPKGFEDAIKFAKEYLEDPNNEGSPAIWTNLASAFGQKASWIMTNERDNELALKEAEDEAYAAASKAVEFGEQWKARIRQLLVKNYPGKEPDDTDLEVFENVNRFRQLVDLPV